jgi:hypothetical protein
MPFIIHLLSLHIQNFELIYLGLSIFRQSSNLNHTLSNYLVQNYTDNIFHNRDIYAPYAGAARLLLHINGKFTI